MDEYSSIEHMRLRPYMYIGKKGNTGFNYLLGYIFDSFFKDNSSLRIFEIIYKEHNSFVLKFESNLIAKIVSEIERLLFDIGDFPLNFGLAILIAHSEVINIELGNNELTKILTAINGNIIHKNLDVSSNEDKLLINFKLEKDFYGDLSFGYRGLCTFLEHFAFLNPNVKIICEDLSSSEFQRSVFYYPRGVFDELDFVISKLPYGQPLFKLEIEGESKGSLYKIGIAYSDLWLDRTYIKTYAENIETFLGGSLYDGIIQGIIRSIKNASKDVDYNIIINKNKVKEQLLMVATVTGDEIVYGGSVKRELYMPSLKRDVSKDVFDKMTAYLDKNPICKENLLKIFIKYDE